MYPNSVTYFIKKTLGHCQNCEITHTVEDRTTYRLLYLKARGRNFAKATPLLGQV